MRRISVLRLRRHWLPILLGIALPALLAAALLARPTRTPAPVELPELAVGDWIFRSGTSTDSTVIRQLSGSDYSHIGMVVANSPQVLIIHATTDDEPQRQNQVLLTPLEDFIHPDLANAFAIARPDFLDAEQKALIAETLLAQRGEAFLIQPRGEPHRYCTTLLADAIRTQHADFSPRWSLVDVAFFRGEYLFPRAFAEHARISWVYRP